MRFHEKTPLSTAIVHLTIKWQNCVTIVECLSLIVFRRRISNENINKTQLKEKNVL